MNTSLGKLDRSPARVDRSPAKVDTSPAKVDTSPEKTGRIGLTELTHPRARQNARPRTAARPYAHWHAVIGSCTIGRVAAPAPLRNPACPRLSPTRPSGRPLQKLPCPSKSRPLLLPFPVGKGDGLPVENLAPATARGRRRNSVAPRLPPSPMRDKARMRVAATPRVPSRSHLSLLSAHSSPSAEGLPGNRPLVTQRSPLGAPSPASSVVRLHACRTRRPAAPQPLSS